MVERLQAPVVPHMGWNTVERARGLAAVRRGRGRAVLLRALLRRTLWELDTNGRTAAAARHVAEHGGDRFVAAVENGPLCATQFHPEKSGDAGAALLPNWVASLPGG